METPDRGAPPGGSLHDAAAYTATEAARYVKVPVATLRSWFSGRSYPTVSGQGRFQPLIQPPRQSPLLLSFSNLIEAHVLRSLRLDHSVSVGKLRQALAYAEDRLGIQRLLLHREIGTYGGQIFLEHYGHLINLNLSGQLAMRKVFEAHIQRIDWTPAGLPARLYPFVQGEEAPAMRPITIDPRIAFGRPVVTGKAVSTHVIAARIDAGESVPSLASDYGMTESEIEDAVLYEHAA